MIEATIVEYASIEPVRCVMITSCDLTPLKQLSVGSEFRPHPVCLGRILVLHQLLVGILQEDAFTVWMVGDVFGLELELLEQLDESFGRPNTRHEAQTG